jgi:hypothetical protein
VTAIYRVPIRAGGRWRLVDVDNAVVAGNIGFMMGVFLHSTLRPHLSPQQQDKSDEERDANNRWRSERRQILQQDAASLPLTRVLA